MVSDSQSGADSGCLRQLVEELRACMLSWLWKNRERPALCSLRWWKVWAKRALTLPQLLAAVYRVRSMVRQGAQIALPAFISPSVWNGKAENLELGKGSYVGRAEVHLHQRVRIGQDVIINDGVRLLTASHDVTDPDFGLIKGPIVIEDYAWIAIGAILLPGVTIGKGAVVGAGAVVSANVPDYAVAVGNPARLLNKTRPQDLRYKPLRGLAVFEAWLGRS
jgi:acetyltransferase-like isoleucine patch superfamily enzyme